MLNETTSNAPFAYRIKDFCAQMGISPSTLWKLAKEDKIRLVRIGGCTLVPASEVPRLLNKEAER